MGHGLLGALRFALRKLHRSVATASAKAVSSLVQAADSRQRMGPDRHTRCYRLNVFKKSNIIVAKICNKSNALIYLDLDLRTDYCNRWNHFGLN